MKYLGNAAVGKSWAIGLPCGVQNRMLHTRFYASTPGNGPVLSAKRSVGTPIAVSIET